MEFIKTKQEEHVLHILLDRDPSNAIHQEMVRELLSILLSSKEDPSIEGLVLTGKEHFFSSGLDFITLFDYDKLQIGVFWKDFMMLLKELISFPKPLVAAISGYSPAAGCLLAMCCDYRVMAEGNYHIGPSEVSLGVVVPSRIFDLYRFWLGNGAAYRSLLSGELYTPQEAQSVGLVDEVVALERLQSTAVNKLKRFMQFEKNVWQGSKLNLRSQLIATFNSDPEDDIHQILHQWWQPSNRAIMKTIIDNLASPKA